MAEFADAIRATCPPRFPKARGDLFRQVGLAVSGGVDSMALAFLCNRFRQQDSYVRVSDNHVSGFRGIVVDHGLREGSFEEANAVADALRDMNVASEVVQLNWTKVLVLGPYNHPKELPNFESVARRLRYRRIGAACSFRKIVSLLLAHHEDDQYETVLMRLLQGHGGRGLHGMKKANDIPECDGMYGAYQSGYVEDQKRTRPFYNYNVPRQELKALRKELKLSIHRLMLEEELHDMTAQGTYRSDAAGSNDYGNGLKGPSQSKHAMPLEVDHNIEIEDGGIAIYRPLLEFSKDRLIATCLENNIPWWEDSTNHDATLTRRNAVRHLYKGYDLPKALQKPAILSLSQRCARRAQAYAASVNRLLSRAIIHEFETHVGTAVVQFPHLDPPDSRRETRSPERRHARIAQQREVAGILIQKILALVSPDPQLPRLVDLQIVISRLFPPLASPSEAALVKPAKAFSIAGVHLIPLASNSLPESPTTAVRQQQQQQPLSWYLARTPYPSNLPLPRFRMPYWSVSRRTEQPDNEPDDLSSNNSYLMGLRRWPWSKWMRWELWDNRFWLRLTHRLPYRVIVQPFAKEHAKPFRELLPPDDRTRLAALLKRYAPGKVRYTLPAIYLEEALDLENVQPRPNYPCAPRSEETVTETETKMMTPSKSESEGRCGEGKGEDKDEDEDEARKDRSASTDLGPSAPDLAKMKLLALPTLNVRIPRLEEWLHYDVRYRKVERGTLETAGTFHRGSFAPPRRRRR